MSGAMFDLLQHSGMLRRVARLHTYKEALRGTVGTADVVLEVGSGTGVLPATDNRPETNVSFA